MTRLPEPLEVDRAVSVWLLVCDCPDERVPASTVPAQSLPLSPPEAVEVALAVAVADADST